MESRWLFVHTMLDCMFQLCKLEGHPVNRIHHQISGDLKMNQIVRMIEQLYVYFFLKDASKQTDE